MSSHEIFTVPALSFSVFQRDDGSIFWSDSYKGEKVRAALPIDHGRRCIILLESDAREKARFENLFCVDADGTVLWVAPLPETQDVFVRARMVDSTLLANSWSGFQLTLDSNTGRVLGQEFTK